MSWTNILSVGTLLSMGSDALSAGASEPTGLATSNVPRACHSCCQPRSMSPASSAV